MILVIIFKFGEIIIFGRDKFPIAFSKDNIIKTFTVIGRLFKKKKNCLTVFTSLLREKLEKFMKIRVKKLKPGYYHRRSLMPCPTLSDLASGIIQETMDTPKITVKFFQKIFLKNILSLEI